MGSDRPASQAWTLEWMVRQIERCTSADNECEHGHLPIDRNITCTCFVVDVNAERALNLRLELMENRERERHEEMVSALRAMTETLAALARDQRVVSRAVLDAANGTHR